MGMRETMQNLIQMYNQEADVYEKQGQGGGGMPSPQDPGGSGVKNLTTQDLALMLGKTEGMGRDRPDLDYMLEPGYLESAPGKKTELLRAIGQGMGGGVDSTKRFLAGQEAREGEKDRSAEAWKTLQHLKGILIGTKSAEKIKGIEVDLKRQAKEDKEEGPPGYSEDLQIAYNAIRGIGTKDGQKMDPVDAYQRLAIKYKTRSAELKRIFILSEDPMIALLRFLEEDRKR